MAARRASACGCSAALGRRATRPNQQARLLGGAAVRRRARCAADSLQLGKPPAPAPGLLFAAWRVELQWQRATNDLQPAVNAALQNCVGYAFTPPHYVERQAHSKTMAFLHLSSPRPASRATHSRGRFAAASRGPRRGRADGTCRAATAPPSRGHALSQRVTAPWSSRWSPRRRRRSRQRRPPRGPPGRAGPTPPRRRRRTLCRSARAPRA